LAQGLEESAKLRKHAYRGIDTECPAMERPLADYSSWTYENGLHLIVQTVPEVRSAAFTLLVPAGTMYDPADKLGLAYIASDMVQRGAGSRDSRALTSELDSLGVQRAESAEIRNTSFAVASLAENLEPTLAIFSDIVQRPHLDAQQLEGCKAAVIQEIEAIEDDASQKLFIDLRRRALPPPLGQPAIGELATVPNISVEDLRQFVERRYRPNGAILGVAGAVEFNAVRDLVGRHLGTWPKKSATEPTIGRPPAGRGHLPDNKLQTHIGMAFPSVAYSDADYFNAHGVVGVLSGGMSSRLFVEVREKRGLCYSVNASYYALKDRGLIIGYAGTTNERAAETYQVMCEEFSKLSQGIDQGELDRVKIGLRASLIMQEESTSARASVLARTFANLGRVRTLDETAAEIEKLSVDGLLGYMARHPLENPVVSILGPSPLEASA
jgi:predicted Zn-dependent peptidase